VSYLLDTDICSTFLRRPRGLFHRFMQHAGRLHVSTVGLSELYAWAYKQDDPTLILDKIQDFLHDVQVMPFDESCAREVGRLRGAFLRQGVSVSAVDLMIAVTAIVNSLTLVTHNVKDFANIPGLKLEDWLAS
jgi:tRNA(fMet)-specific endonuclease VapC